MHVLDLRGPGQGHERWGQLCARSAGLEGPADVAAREVIAAVRERGDAAVAELTLRFEGRQLERFELTPHERAAACEAIPGELRHALDLAAANIRRFHATQLPHDTGLHDDDSHLVSRARPLRRVAVYAPGGTAAYPSSVLMTAIPAKVAGVAEVILFTPRPDPVVLLAAELDRCTRANPELEVILLTFVLPPATDHPWHDLDVFETLVRGVRDAYEARVPAGLRFYMVGFHPRLQGPDPRRPATPDGLVPWLRRTPDPVIQCIRADLLDQVRRQAQAAANARFLEEMGRLGPEYRALAATAIQSDPELSADIARHNFASVGTGTGRAELDQRIAALLAARADL